MIDRNATVRKLQEFIEKEKQIIMQAYKAGYIEGQYLDYYPDKHSLDYYNGLLSGEQEIF